MWITGLKPPALWKCEKDNLFTTAGQAEVNSSVIHTASVGVLIHIQIVFLGIHNVSPALQQAFNRS